MNSIIASNAVNPYQNSILEQDNQKYYLPLVDEHQNTSLYKDAQQRIFHENYGKNKPLSDIPRSIRIRNQQVFQQQVAEQDQGHIDKNAYLFQQLNNKQTPNISALDHLQQHSTDSRFRDPRQSEKSLKPNISYGQIGKISPFSHQRDNDIFIDPYTNHYNSRELNTNYDKDLGNTKKSLMNTVSNMVQLPSLSRRLIIKTYNIPQLVLITQNFLLNRERPDVLTCQTQQQI
ncbi:UNKNOWN [Stylonychia lemnae]|uniref:Uncharacterized protein n=1 Tax=Stylonychia lemnae TaxID=5949 RepID=A0A078B9V1_STYLE|nr:UNKNOWN [Stylonychia lemnae]|eukprot:CDW91295.1 UNKNOWN [Stylonychia lemnae]